MFTIPVLFEEFKRFIDGWIVGLFGRTEWTEGVVNLTILVFLLATLLILFSAVLAAIKKIYEFWKEVIVPKFYNSERRRRQFRRHMFADHVESEIRYMNSLESWNDNRFTELEAHVEAQGSQKLFGLISQRIFSGSRLRLEKSLSEAIEKSTERLVLLEGDPGSGKSVVLRHVTQLMAAKARKSRNLRTRIPIYVNLKYLRRSAEEPVDRNLIERFVFKTLNRVNDRDVDEYLHDEFTRGVSEGTWFFLFDAFDEIPEILSSTGADDVIRSYAQSIRDFLHGMNNCKGIVASREYKGPRFLAWPRFRVLPLESSRRIDLIKRTGLAVNVQKKIIHGLAIAKDDFRVMSSNPMFLNLICDFMNKQVAPEFPKHIHVVFQEYVLRRLTRDEERVQQRFNKHPQDIQDAAEKLAFCMTADQGIGLSPALTQLEHSTEEMNLSLGDSFNILLESLAYLKLARIDTSFVDGIKTFTFAHRRFQEYFATAVVLRQPERVGNEDLLTNGRWRETAVVILQTQSSQRIRSLLISADALLQKMGVSFSEVNKDLGGEDVETVGLPRYQLWSLARLIFEPFAISQQKIEAYLNTLLNDLKNREENRKKGPVLDLPIVWPSGLYHLISVLQEGLSGQVSPLPEETQRKIDKILIHISRKGDFIDEKMCLELCGITSEICMADLIAKGIERKSRITQQIAYRQASRLQNIPIYISSFIRRTIFEQAISGKLFFERQEVNAQISRLQNAASYLLFASLLTWAPIIDLVLLLVGWRFLNLNLDVNYALYGLNRLLGLIALIMIWVLSWFSGDRLLTAYVRLGGWFTLILPLLLNNFDKGFSMELFSPNAISISVYLVATGWGTVLITVLSSPRIRKFPHLILVPFLGFIPALIFWVPTIVVSLLLSSKLVIPIIDFLKPYYVPFLYTTIFLLGVDWLYFVPRLGLLYKEIPTEYKGRKLINLISGIPYEFGLMLEIIVILGCIFILFPTFIVWFTVLLNFPILVLMMLTISEIVYPFIQDAIRYFAWRRMQSPMDFLSFVRYLELSKSDLFRTRIVNTVSRKQLLVPDLRNEKYLRNLISFVTGRVINSRDGQFEKINELDPQLGACLTSDNWSINQLDELTNMFDQIQAARYGSS